MTGALSAWSRLPGDPVPMIGHNEGPPLDPGRSWRAHCWKAARAELLPRLPIEVLRRRVRRAQELGLAYPAYASILLGSGRDVVAFLFTAEAVGLRVLRAAAQAGIAEAAAAKLGAIVRAQRLLMVEDADAVRPTLASGAPFDAAGAAPRAGASPKAGAAAVGALLDPRALPRDAVVMVGARPDERGWAEAARLARFLGAEAYFGR
ncbi:hypothetical protein [Rubrimonas sp.]|uniref:hypothetical protein n=1 Tax=Rubrimonas sp. TaxID=2036015 RepID=UPI002FDD8415